MDRSTEEHKQTPLSANAARIEHEIEGHLKHGHSAQKTVHDEIYKLRKLDSSHGKLNQRAYHSDLAAIDKQLHTNGYLPHMHILHHGHHAGELASDKSQDHAPQADKAHVDKAHLDKAHVDKAHVDKAHIDKAHVDKAHVDKAHIDKAHVDKAHVTKADGSPGAAPRAVHRHAQAEGTETPARALAPEPAAASTERRVASVDTSVIPGLPAAVNPDRLTDQRTPAADTVAVLPRSAARDPRTDERRTEVPPPPAVADDQTSANYTQLRSAIERAKAGGRPVSVLQYGDSHIADGHESAEIKDDLAKLAPDKYATKAKKGTSADYPLRDPKSWLDKPISAAKPDLIVVSYGSNDVDMNWGSESYKKVYDNLISNIKQRAPNATLLLVGPTDRFPGLGLGLDKVIAVQKEVAAKYGADYYDIRQAMGGSGVIDKLRAQGLAEPDRWHLTDPGYQLVGDMISKHIQDQL